MKPFEYAAAASVEEAVALLADPASRLLSGGTNLVDLMKLGVERPSVLVDTRRLALNNIEVRPDGAVEIGATVTNSDLAAHPEIRRRFPAITQAVLAGASGQIRNMATVGGNLLQRTRCSYFTDVASACNKRVPGSGCPAIRSERDGYAILGTSSHCIAVHPSDLCVALAAFDAVVSFVSRDGAGEIPLVDLHVPVGDTPHVETALPRSALITRVTVPPASAASRSRYRKVRERASYAFALASIAAALEVREGIVREARLAFGGVASRPWRARQAERVLVGARADAEIFARAVDAELAAANPRAEETYKVELMRNLAVSVLAEIVGESK